MDKNEYNKMVSDNKKNALQGAYSNIGMDYTKVLMSMGEEPALPELSREVEPVSIAINPDFQASHDLYTLT